jgi:hypothetical protein
MSGHNTAPSKGKAQAPPASLSEGQLSDDRDDRFLIMESNLQALQQAQTKQGLDYRQKLSSIKDMLVQIMACLTADNLQSSIEKDTLGRDMPGSTLSQSGKSSKKVPDPVQLSNGVNPTFESWRIEIWDKLYINSDHFLTEEDQMFYIFGHTTEDVQKHLLSHFDEDFST